MVGATIVPGGEVEVTGIYLGRQRTGFVDVLVRMGASIEVRPAADGAGSLTCRAASLRGTVVRAEEIPSLDEVPVLAVAAAVARGETRFHDVGELRVKESDRLRARSTCWPPSGPRPPWRATTWWWRAGPRCARPPWTPGGTTAWPWPPPWPAPPVRARRRHHRDGLGRRGHQLPGFADDLAALARGVGR